MDDWEYNLIKREVLSLTGVDLNQYKAQQMQRRLNTYLLRSGQPGWVDFLKHIKTKPEEISKFKDYLTINVSSFFRDADKYKALQSTILPELLQNRTSYQAQLRSSAGSATAGRGLRVWSAGCSRGQEPYTLAMVLAGLTGPYTNHYILATDLDRSALAYAQAAGPYTHDDVAYVSPDLLQRYFKTENGSYFVNQQLKAKITFKQHNLLADKFENDFDLIVCRNVVIYFTAEVKDQLYRRFAESLRVGGILFVGGTEIVSKASDIGLQTAGISFYRRNGAG